jgi:DNA mismatch repair protein MutS
VPDFPELPEHPALSSLRDITPDELSPKQALEKLYQLKKLL